MLVDRVSRRCRSVRAMELPAAITTWTSAGAARNARRSLDEWTRAQDEVAELLARLAAQRGAEQSAGGEATSSAA